MRGLVANNIEQQFSWCVVTPAASIHRCKLKWSWRCIGRRCFVDANNIRGPWFMSRCCIFGLRPYCICIGFGFPLANDAQTLTHCVTGHLHRIRLSWQPRVGRSVWTRSTIVVRRQGHCSGSSEIEPVPAWCIVAAAAVAPAQTTRLNWIRVHSSRFMLLSFTKIWTLCPSKRVSLACPGDASKMMLFRHLEAASMPSKSHSCHLWVQISVNFGLVIYCLFN